MDNILIFAGTIEGRSLAESLSNRGAKVFVSVATEYGETLICERDNLTVSAKRMTTDEMVEYIKAHAIKTVVDATHPYAAEVTRNIKAACDTSGVEYLRLIRSSNADSSDCIWVDSVEAAVAYLADTTGNVLLTTGSKELVKYTGIPDYKNRLYARVLSTAEVAVACKEIGFEGKNLICMQGPFTEELDYAMLRQIEASFLVTKDTGKAGGFIEKINAARRAGAKLIIVGRPIDETGMTYSELLAFLCKKLELSVKQKVTIIGIGMGTIEGMTIEAYEACKNCDLLIGADRMLDNLRDLGKPEFVSYKYGEIAQYIKEHTEYENIVVAMSGDVGFYSGTKKLLGELEDMEVEIMPGISSVVYLCAKVGQSWDDAKLMSIHGRSENIVAEVKNNSKVFSLMGGKGAVNDLCRLLLQYNLDQVTIYVGEQLSYPDERFTCGSPEELLGKDFNPLCVVLIVNDAAKGAIITHGISDTEFIRGKVPMTKEEVRSISLSKLRLTRDAVCYDVGAGTGSVSIEMAAQATAGMVYAVEKNPDGLALIKQNMEKMGISNIELIEGLAPEAMTDLPVPSHAFIGGSSGNMKDILKLLLEKNPNIRVVINVIALESISETLDCVKSLGIEDAEIVSVSVARSKVLGRYHMMMGENPIYIVSFGGKQAE